MTEKLEKTYSDMLFGSIAIERGFLAPAQLKRCLAIQADCAQKGRHLQLGEILRRKGFLDAQQLDSVTKLQRRLEEGDTDIIFGKIAVASELVSVEAIEETLIEQRSLTDTVPIGELLVKANLMTEQQRDAVLEAQKRIRRDVSLQELEEKTVRAKGRFGPYRLEREISRGGMGIIYKAVHLNLGRVVAVKTLSPEFSERPELIKRFRVEAQALAKLTHPNIVQVYNVGRIEGTYFLEMEYIEGVDILDFVEKNGPLPKEKALEILSQVAEALSRAWEKGIVHRDVKPENILLSSAGEVKLADFGIVKLAGGEGQQRGNTQVGEVVGSPYYIAPEQAKNAKDIDFRVDVYSLGATFFRLVTGRLVFEGNSSMEVIAKHLHKPMPKLEELPVQLEPAVYQVIQYMMQKNPANRPESWDEVKQLFADLATPEGCPNCDSPMKADDIICIECGFNRKIGVQLMTTIGRKTPVVTRSGRSKKKPGKSHGSKRKAGGAKKRVAKKATQEKTGETTGQKTTGSKKTMGARKSSRRRRRRRH